MFLAIEEAIRVVNYLWEGGYVFTGVFCLD